MGDFYVFLHFNLILSIKHSTICAKMYKILKYFCHLKKCSLPNQTQVEKDYNKQHQGPEPFENQQPVFVDNQLRWERQKFE